MITIQVQTLQEFTAKIFEACGSPPAEAAIVADHLVIANMMDFDSHGVIRVPEYVELVKKGAISPGASTSTIQETENTAVIDCARNFGQVSATGVMTVAIEKAAKANLATVVTRRCSHVGRLGHYTEMAARQGFVAFA